MIYKVNGVFPPGLLPFVAIQQQFFEQAKKELLYSEISRLRADIIDSSSEWLVSGPGMGEMGLKLEDVLRSMKMNVDPLSI